MWSDWWLIPMSVIAGVVLIWAALIVALWFVKPDDVGVPDAMRLLPDLLQLLKRLAFDPTMPRGIRVRLVLLLGVPGITDRPDSGFRSRPRLRRRRDHRCVRTAFCCAACRPPGVGQTLAGHA
jgi:hypothetical protein